MATNITTASFYTLPTELLYRILDILDNDTIIFSFGSVCKRFRTIINTYNRYNFNFQSISKPYFNSICNLIDPGNIISLTLSNDNKTPDQIKCFLSLFNIEQFICLRSLTLIQIEENEFDTMFESKCINLPLHSLSITFRNNSKTLPLLSSVIPNKNLQHLTLSLKKFDNLIWPDKCFLQSLIMSNRINFQQFSTILSHSLQLKKLVLQDCIIDDSVPIDCTISYPQLISLSFEDCELDMNQCELILTLLPSLEHLHIVGGTDLSNGSRWEEFIQKKLLKLIKFEFAFCGNTEILFEDSCGVQSLIVSFRTPFWIEIKQWFVVCYYFKDAANYSLYSLPICKSSVRFYPQKDKISCSTYRDLNTDVSMTDNVQQMQLNLTSLMANQNQNQKSISSSNNPYFRKLNKLLLCIENEWPIGSVEYLLTFITLSCITELSITIDFDSVFVADISYLLKQTCNLHSLIIDSSPTSAEKICLLVPYHIKHLQVSVKHTDDMKLIIGQLKHLLSVTFEYFRDCKFSLEEFSMWLMEKRNNSNHRYDNIFFSIWFDKISS